MLCVYTFKQLVGGNEIDYHLSAQNYIGKSKILYFSIFHMNEMKHQQNHIWFKGENLKIKHINAIKYMFK